MDDMEAVLIKENLIEEDIELIEECKLGDRDAFRKLVKKYQGKVYSIALRMLKNTQEAQDVSQDVFFAVYRSIKRFRGDSKLSTWLYRITVNSSINKLKSLKNRKLDNAIEFMDSVKSVQGHDLKEPTYSSVPDPVGALEKKNLNLAIEKEIAKLPDENRVIVIMRDIEGLAYEEISEILNLPQGTVKSRLHRGRMELRNKLKKYL